jgi:hypothetical protein
MSLLRTALALGLSLCCAVAAADDGAATAQFSGTWETTYGRMTLTQEGARVRGTYGGSSRIQGTVSGRKLTFRYTETGARGEGWFELSSDGKRFSGKWRAKGEEAWSGWEGTRRGDARPTGPLDGLYETEHGRVRLIQGKGSEVRGLYAYDGGRGTLSGTAEGRKLTFTWTEKSMKGYGEFSVDEAGKLTGRWRGASGDAWQSWNGTRVVARPGVVWLTILEAQWETSLGEPEYAFGDMLRSFFRRYPHVQVRQRRVNDEADLLRAARQIPLLAEPVVLLVASHGEKGHLMAGADAVPAVKLAEALADASNLELIHFSSCEILVPGVAESFHERLGHRVPLSGYGVTVDWAGSAVLEFLYLDLVVGRRLSPSKAAKVVRAELNFAGETPTDGSPLGEAKFRFVE